MSEQIELMMRQVKLGGMAKGWRSVSFTNPEQYVADLLKLELQEREANRINRMVKTAGFRVMKTLDEFVWNSAIELPHGLTREYMEELHFLAPKENLIFMGAVGTGKTHLATAIALKACQEGRRVRFFTAAELANILLERNTKGTLNSFLGTLNSLLLTRSASCRFIRTLPSCCFRLSRIAMNARASSLHPTWSSHNGTLSLEITDSPQRLLTV